MDKRKCLTLETGTMLPLHQCFDSKGNPSDDMLEKVWDAFKNVFEQLNSFEFHPRDSQVVIAIQFRKGWRQLEDGQWVETIAKPNVPVIQHVPKAPS